MSYRKITAPQVPEPPGGIYSNCLVVGEQIFMSGMTSSGEGMEAQARGVFSKIRNLLEAAGATMADILKMTVYVTDMSKRPEFGKVRAEFFPGNKPCSTLVEVSALAGPDFLIEVDVTALKGVSRS